MDARVKQLVNMIEDAQPVAVAVLAKRLEVSERAVRNYIHRANDSLAGVARIVGSKGQYRIDVARADELARLLKVRLWPIRAFLIRAMAVCPSFLTTSSCGPSG